MKLDLSSLHLALATLERAIIRASAAPADEELRDAVIQRFEYSFELCWKMLKRHLEQVLPNPAAVDRLSFKELIREAAERGLVARVEPWWTYRHQRNLTSHTYDAKNACAVFETALAFHPDAVALLGEIEKRNVD
ncbi:MAG: nucleotidyltransferase substrate binding protein [Deltaproteobacteria bacterium]|nr:nucleotidyltransferase substrate binding protein [Deltaproteobacteria bacterium]